MAISPDRTRERGGLLTGWLCFVILVSLWTAFRYFAPNEELIDYSDPRVVGTLRFALPLGLLAIVNIGAGILLFLWKKIGFYILLLTAITEFVINLNIGIPLEGNLSGLAVVTILWVLLQPYWHHFD
ncbi:MAG: hypothetical protein HC769_21435 [Cyanobacteria bacterium CRU_2_1]|nr:hypothetical protein [Cyanobacteria bacterium RU_5_0]NJR61162.1 hypothetical protein [Cyanobacteria bacterium CRU_2_1]